MDKEWLRERLDAGMSIQAIADEAGRGASTVGYWITRHGLVPAGRERHAPKGGVDEALLRELVAAGLSIRQIAAELDLSYTAVRHQLTKHALKTEVPGRRRPGHRWCDRHDGPLYEYAPGRFRCRRCVSEAVTRWRRRKKALLVQESGGCCRRCGYDACVAALEFHHVDPATKSFAISVDGTTRSLAALREEAAKCVLLCSNCHAEVEAGVTQLPFPAADASGE